VPRTDLGRPAAIWRRIAGLANTQHGVVAAWQLLGFGRSRRWISHQVELGRLTVIHVGVYAVGTPRLSDRGRLSAAVLACGPRAALSHRCAAALLGWMSLGRLSVDVTGTVARRHRGVRVWRTRSLPESDVCVIDGIRVTSMARTLLDLAAVLTRGQLAEVVDEARFKGLDALAIRRYVDDRGLGRKGIGELRLLLSDANVLRSELERRFKKNVLGRIDLAAPLTNVRDSVEGRTYELDNFWPEAELVVELDGFKHHGRRAQFERDTERDAAFLAIDRVTMRVTWRQVTDSPGLVARRVADAYAARTARRADGVSDSGLYTASI
jgi:hypothetical protein